MDFDDAPEEIAFREEARRWLDGHAPPKGSAEDFSSVIDPASEWDDVVDRARRWQRLLFDAGWAGISFPKEYGGRGGTTMEELIFAQESARYGVHTGPFMVAHTMVGPALLAFGTEEQRERHIEPMLRGDDIWCQLFSEPGAGSDLAGLRTTAVRGEHGWVIDGQKVWTSNAGDAQWGILLARTGRAPGAGPDDVRPHHGITYFLVRMDAPGIEVRPLRQITGESHFSEVFLTGVRLPHDAVLGGDAQIGRGWLAAMHTLGNERNMIGSASFERDVEGLAVLAGETGADRDPVFRQDLARVHTTTQVLTFLSHRIRTTIARGDPPGPEASMLKLLYGRYLRSSMALGVQAAGMSGVAGLGPGTWPAYFAHRLVWATHTSIAGGTDEIQKNILAERVLGLPREPRPAPGGR